MIIKNVSASTARYPHDVYCSQPLQLLLEILNFSSGPKLFGGEKERMHMLIVFWHLPLLLEIMLLFYLLV